MKNKVSPENTKVTHHFAVLEDGGAPLYVQIASVFRRKMRSGEWPVGMQLPTLEQLAQQLNVARVTIRQAMDLLEAERLIWRRQGKGTFVTAHARSRHWLTVATDWKELVRLIEGTESKLLESRDSANMPPLAGGEGRSTGSYRFLRKLHSYEGAPHLVLEIFLDKGVYEMAEEEFDSLPIIPVMSRLNGIEIGKAHQTLTVSVADPEISRYLNIDVGAATVEVVRSIQAKNEDVIYFGHLTYRADSFRLEMDLKK
ncbi:MAG: GntR family transcriptional regulator [Roseitalea sp.]|uniref:GntR family transcriptional regulator n=1 Tax=Oceaniradius stylonematis TaxID=2184161 RepID=UPI000D6C3391|nr:GntR family transcriptional regulator [Oceaniradius stylonematis]MBO6552630.1 GntR family transcriptional regulator [Roseitalea sp.]MBO6950450.1 GntR family transcriptional regulator [Rhizobiaceae bacterium]MBO6591562.1 GntR family transcriptional regulator [Roseitalea sp.]MBO6599417.1 GntR family transcriptional regulator [Roseitalea sp.]MBO6612094.1 GntR family transcriptional regulator [Roseitalea sp.]